MIIQTLWNLIKFFFILCAAEILILMAAQMIERYIQKRK